MTDPRLSRRALLASLGATAAGAAAGCTAPSRSPDTTTPAGTAGGGEEPAISLSADAAWTTYGFDPGHTGHNTDAAGVRDDPSRVWGTGVSGIYTLREPAVAEGTVFVGSKQSMYAFDAATGESAWRTDQGAMSHHFAPTYRDGRLFTVSKESGGDTNGAPGYVRSLDPADGDVQWSTSLPVTSTVTHDGSRLYVATKRDGTGYVQALDPASGEAGWRFAVPDGPRSEVAGAPAYADGVLYVPGTLVADDGSKSGRLYALDPATGEVSWSVGASGALNVAPVATGDRVYQTARDGTVHAVTPDGDTAWTRGLDKRIYTRPAYADGRLFVLTVGDVVALDAAGEQLWRAGSERTQMTGMAVAGDTLYVGGEPLFAVDVASGDAAFELPVDAFHATYGAPVVVEDVLYAGICIKQRSGAMYDNFVRAFT